MAACPPGAELSPCLGEGLRPAGAEPGVRARPELCPGDCARAASGTQALRVGRAEPAGSSLSLPCCPGSPPAPPGPGRPVSDRCWVHPEPRADLLTRPPLSCPSSSIVAPPARLPAPEPADRGPALPSPWGAAPGAGGVSWSSPLPTRPAQWPPWPSGRPPQGSLPGPWAALGQWPGPGRGSRGQGLPDGGGDGGVRGVWG